MYYAMYISSSVFLLTSIFNGVTFVSHGYHVLRLINTVTEGQGRDYVERVSRIFCLRKSRFVNKLKSRIVN